MSEQKAAAHILTSMGTAVFGFTDGYIAEGVNILIKAVATPTPPVLVVKELVARDKKVVKAKYVRNGKNCVLR